eukprot:COSAG01_NODE_654_length_14482_cov_20.826347_12_plen_318_part_00
MPTRRAKASPKARGGTQHRTEREPAAVHKAAASRHRESKEGSTASRSRPQGTTDPIPVLFGLFDEDLDGLLSHAEYSAFCEATEGGRKVDSPRWEQHCKRLGSEPLGLDDEGIGIDAFRRLYEDPKFRTDKNRHWGRAREELAALRHPPPVKGGATSPAGGGRAAERRRVRRAAAADEERKREAEVEGAEEEGEGEGEEEEEEFRAREGRERRRERERESKRYSRDRDEVGRRASREQRAGDKSEQREPAEQARLEKREREEKDKQQKRRGQKQQQQHQQREKQKSREERVVLAPWPADLRQARGPLRPFCLGGSFD